MSDERIQALELRLNAVETKFAVTEVVGVGIEKRLDKIEGTLTWLVRLIIGSMIAAMMAFVFSGGINVG